MKKYPPQFMELVADTYLHTDLSLTQVANMYGVSLPSVRKWARMKDPHTYAISKGKTRQLLMAQDILEAQPNIRAEELSKLVGVTRTTVNDWNEKGKIELDIQCDICGEATTTKYCKACTEKGWHFYVLRMEITYDELRTMPTACEVCGNTENLHVDHDHVTGKYRGVLCHHCNVALGMVSDDIERLKKLVKYLKSNNNKDKPERNIIKSLRKKYAYKLQDTQGYSI